MREDNRNVGGGGWRGEAFCMDTEARGQKQDYQLRVGRNAVKILYLFLNLKMLWENAPFCIKFMCAWKNYNTYDM